MKLENGEAAFNGTVTGKWEDPHIMGHGQATNVVWSGRTFTAVSGDIDLNSTGLTVLNGDVRLGGIRAQGAGSLGMRDWAVEDASPVSSTGFIRNAPAADLMAMADIKNVPLEASVSADAKIEGAIRRAAYLGQHHGAQRLARRRTIRPLHGSDGLLRR